MHIELWGSAPESHINKIKVKVNSVLIITLGVRFINGRPLMSNDALYKAMGLLNVNSLFKCRIYRLLLLILRGHLPLFYDQLLKPYEYNHRYRTRSGMYKYPHVTCEVERRAASYQLIKLYNDIPENFNSDVSIGQAVKNFKCFLLQNQ